MSIKLQDQVSQAARLRDKLRRTLAEAKVLLRDTEKLLEKSRRDNAS